MADGIERGLLPAREFRVTGRESLVRTEYLAAERWSITRDGEPGAYDVMVRRDGVMVIPQLLDGRLLLLRQFRFPTESDSWEFPMGYVDAGETAAAAAARELEEETGLSGELRQVGRFHPQAGLSPQRVTVFVASVGPLAPGDLARPTRGMDEIRERRLVPERELDRMLAAGEITEGFSLAALTLRRAAG